MRHDRRRPSFLAILVLIAAHLAAKPNDQGLTTPTSPTPPQLEMFVNLTLFEARNGSRFLSVPGQTLYHGNNGILMYMIERSVNISAPPQATDAWSFTTLPGSYEDYVQYLYMAAELTWAACESVFFVFYTAPIHQLQSDFHSFRYPASACSTDEHDEPTHPPTELEYERLYAALPDNETAPQLHWPSLTNTLHLTPNQVAFACRKDASSCTLPLNTSATDFIVHHYRVDVHVMTVPPLQANPPTWNVVCSNYKADYRSLCRKQSTFQQDALTKLPFNHDNVIEWLRRNATGRHPWRLQRVRRNIVGALLGILDLLQLRQFATKLHEIAESHNDQVERIKIAFDQNDLFRQNITKTENITRTTNMFLLKDAAHNAQFNFFSAISTSFNTVHTTILYLLTRFEQELQHPTAATFATLLNQEPSFRHTAPIHYQYDGFLLEYAFSPTGFEVNISAPFLPKNTTADVYIYRTQINHCYVNNTVKLIAHYNNHVRLFRHGDSLSSVISFLTPRLDHSKPSKVARTPDGSFYLENGCNSAFCHQDDSLAHYRPFEVDLHNIDFFCTRYPPFTHFTSTTGFSVSTDTKIFLRLKTCFSPAKLTIPIPPGQTSVNFGFNTTKLCNNSLPLITLPFPLHNDFENRYTPRHPGLAPDLIDMASSQYQILVGTTFSYTAHYQQAQFPLPFSTGSYFNATGPPIETTDIPALNFALPDVIGSLTNASTKVITSISKGIANVVESAGTAFTPLAISLTVAASVIVLIIILYIVLRFSPSHSPAPAPTPSNQPQPDEQALLRPSNARYRAAIISNMSRARILPRRQPRSRPPPPSPSTTTPSPTAIPMTTFRATTGKAATLTTATATTSKTTSTSATAPEPMQRHSYTKLLKNINAMAEQANNMLEDVTDNPANSN